MPVDRNGHKLHTGDVINIPCIVVGIDRHSEFINLMVETIEPMFPSDKKTSMIINARQTEIAESLGHSATDIDVTTAISDSGILKTKDLNNAGE